MLKIDRVSKTTIIIAVKELEEKFKRIHLLERDERIKLTRELELLKPDFLKPFYPKWWWWRRCTVKVLIVTDGSLNFGTGAGGLSEFLTAFNRLQATTWNNYQLTLGHRSSSVASTNPLVVNQINSFNFQTSVTLSDFDQVWLFGIGSGAGLPANERTVVESFMDSGGGLFATGDHGSLGSALCGNINRVKDMRHWSDFPNSANNTNEVSMSGRKRNDTNRPSPGDTTSLYFDNQSDDIPQIISVRTFASGLPHPLLSISKRVRPSGKIDVMPDHPHEGECKPETNFIHNGVTISSQVIATSFVLGGSTTNGGNNGKAATDAHSFPSIAVWDGRSANAGRIVVDSTWHHFVNINLNGEGSQGSLFSTNDFAGKQPGLSSVDYVAVRQYFMNIATWMSRKKSWFCWRRFIWIELLRDSQLIEASLNNPIEKLENISLSDLSSIGSLAEEILSSKYSPAFAREFLIEAIEPVNLSFSSLLNEWKPDNKEKKSEYYNPWFNLDIILHTAVGTGFIALRDDKQIGGEDLNEKDLDRVPDVFSKGLSYGFEKSIESLSSNLKQLAKETRLKI